MNEPRLPDLREALRDIALKADECARLGWSVSALATYVNALVGHALDEDRERHGGQHERAD